MKYKVKEFINSKENQFFKFKPDVEFYKTVGINRKRFGMILSGKLEPKSNELENIAKFFNCKVADLVELEN